MLRNDLLFQEKKAAQVAAFFIFKAGGQLEILKLMKLMYLAERESLKRFGESITGDAFVSMPHGPVLSITLNHINHFVSSAQNDGWDSWIADRANNMLALKDASMVRDERDLGALSRADLTVLNDIWREFGHFSAWALREKTHNGLCPEWSDPKGSSRPIPMLKLLEELGHSKKTALAILENMREQTHINELFAHSGKASR